MDGQKGPSVLRDRKWRHFPGNNKFFCNGLLVSSRQVGILVFVAITMLIIAVLFLAFDSRYLIMRIHPIGVGAIFPALGVLGLFYSLAFLLKAGCVDPGIVPRAPPDELSYNISLADEDHSTANKGFVGTPSRYKTLTVNGQQLKVKFCVTCNIWRPPRASHCGLCNNCQENFDHHCPWVGNCVAKRNYRYFYLFLCAITVMCCFVMGCNIAVIVLASKEDNSNFVNALKNWPASLIEFGVCGIGLISVMGLAGMHTWLIAKMETTNEDIKGTFKKRRQGGDVSNPYMKSRSCCENFCVVICGPFPPSLIDRRGYITEQYLAMSQGDQQYGAISSSSARPPGKDCEEELSATAEGMSSMQQQQQQQPLSPLHPAAAQQAGIRDQSQDDETKKLITSSQSD